MDMKNAPRKDSKTADVAVNLEDIRASVSLLLENRIDYEFRTTVAAELHQPEDIIAVAKWLRGAKRCYIQSFALYTSVLQPD